MFKVIQMYAFKIVTAPANKLHHLARMNTTFLSYTNSAFGILKRYS